MSPDGTRRRYRGRAWLAGGAGLTAIATIIGASARRSITQRATVEDPYAHEDFNRLEDDRSLV
ncbi:alpha/beta hydrolase, partial [Mycobacterium kansasii]